MSSNAVAHTRDEVEIRLAAMDYKEGWFEAV